MGPDKLCSTWLWLYFTNLTFNFCLLLFPKCFVHRPLRVLASCMRHESRSSQEYSFPFAVRVQAGFSPVQSWFKLKEANVIWQVFIWLNNLSLLINYLPSIVYLSGFGWPYNVSSRFCNIRNFETRKIELNHFGCKIDYQLYLPKYWLKGESYSIIASQVWKTWAALPTIVY